MLLKSFVRFSAACTALMAVAWISPDSVQAQTGFRYPSAQNNPQSIPVASPVSVPTPAQAAGSYGPASIPHAVGSGVPGAKVQDYRVIPAGHTDQNGLRVASPVPPPQNQQQLVRQNQMARAGQLPQRRTGVAPAAYTAGPRARNAQLISEMPLSPSAPVVDPGMSYGAALPAGQGYVEAYTPGNFVEEGYGGGCDDCGGSDLCLGGSCGMACDRGGCPPGLIGECWLAGLGGLLYRADYFTGAQSWDSPVFDNSQNSDYNGGSGFYAGTNLGLPLCRLTCGLVSGQVGVRATLSEISGSPNISQIFATGGFYRRVDYGLQFGAVVDYLQEDVLFNAQVMQVRGDIGWVYDGGNTLGFRFAKGIQDEQVPDIVPGAGAAQFRLQTLDNYRVYYRTSCVAGGYSDLYLGWTDDSHILGGIDVDMPITERVALQAGTTYALPTANANLLGGNANDAWNLYVGFVFRPQGRCWYQSYDRPILPVADNGSMILRRGF